MSYSGDEKQRAGKESAGTNSLHILLLDDEQAVLTALSRLLRALGHQCSTATTGEILLDMLEHSRQTSIRYDLAILDIKIDSGMGGIETMQRIKQIDSSIPVMSMSGHPVDTLFHGDEKSGFVAHLEKPFSSKHLSTEIARFCCTASSTLVT